MSAVVLRPVHGFVCPLCNAQPGALCTAPTNTSRVPVPWTHFARQDALNDARAAEAEAEDG